MANLLIAIDAMARIIESARNPALSGAEKIALYSETQVLLGCLAAHLEVEKPNIHWREVTEILQFHIAAILGLEDRGLHPVEQHIAWAKGPIEVLRAA